MSDTKSHPTSKPVSLKERQREARTSLILEAAYDVLIEKGYQDASMDEIAARVGISKGTLYLHFESKEELVFKLIEQEIASFMALVDQVIDEDSTVRSRLERILLETYKHIQSERHFLFVLHAIGLNTPVIRSRLEEQAAAAGLMDRLTALFEEGKQTGEFDATVPTPVMLSLFLSLMRMDDNEQLVRTNELSPQDLLQSVSRVLFHGLLATSPIES